MTARRRAVAKAADSAPTRHEVRRVPDADTRLWAPNLHSTFSFLAIVRLVSALVNIQADCDEAYNYWEPLHQVLYGHGLQTWEYSPVYALRSYLYLVVHGVVGKVAGTVLFGSSKLAIFFGLRTALGFACAFSEALFYRGVVKAFGARTGRYTLLLLAFNSGMFQASTAFLPSSFVMYLLMLSAGFWMSDSTSFSTPALVTGVVAVVCGWPYVGVMCLPFALDAIVRFGVVRPILTGIVVLAIVVAVEIGTNYYFYRAIVLPAVNIVLYNVVSAGSELYGVEPASYYVVNLFLNFNVALPLACLALPIALGVRGARAWYLLPLGVWLGIMFAQPHKEERFLYPIYPYVCLAAAWALQSLVCVLPVGLGRLGVAVFFALYVVTSTLRVVSVTTQYGAPLMVYQFLSTHLEQDAAAVRVCVGKEWHRFPSHFFLPDHARLAFVRSAFRGQLPTSFTTTYAIPEHMNDLNLEEVSRYVDLASCDFVVDRDVPTPSADEPSFAQDPAWAPVYAEPFLLAEASERIARAFYVPFYSASRLVFTNYTVYAPARAQP
ncbi:alpha mannosyltransferase [Achlya hypogyna]|uniref:Mannosyltransferase n=1 Tax=Achlya hypogyna TaxID=1202772 RepID=A0A1V9YIN8_ACHHY|nr:alpha mannosyltransferase [Achlya hypogyna]